MTALGADVSGEILAIEVPERVARVIPLAQPGAGADPDPIVVPGASIWHLISLTGILTAGAAAADRIPGLIVDDGTTVIGAWQAGVAVTAGASVRVTFAASLGYQSATIAGGRMAIGTPFLRLYSGYRLRLSTVSLQAGDQWSELALTVVDISTGHAERELRRQIAQAAGLLPEYPGEGVHLP